MSSLACRKNLLWQLGQSRFSYGLQLTGLSHKEAAPKNCEARLCARVGLRPYYLGVKQNKTQVDYTAYGTGYQVCLPMNLEIIIPSDEPVRLLSAVAEELDYSRQTRTRPLCT